MATIREFRMVQTDDNLTGSSKGKLSQFVAYCAFRVLSAYIFEDYMQKAGFHVAKFNHRHSR